MTRRSTGCPMSVSIATFPGICSRSAMAGTAPPSPGSRLGCCSASSRASPDKGDELFGFSRILSQRGNQIVSRLPVETPATSCNRSLRTTLRNVFPTSLLLARVGFHASASLKQPGEMPMRSAPRAGDPPSLPACRIRRQPGRDRRATRACRLPATPRRCAAARLLDDSRRRRRLHRAAGLCRRDRPQRQRLSARHQHPRRAPALAVPHGAHAAAAAGEDGALLAQPLRDRLHEDQRRDRRRRFATRMLAAKPRGPRPAKGQLELFREYALGNFRDLLIEVAKDPAMLVWLDGRTNFAPGRRRTSPAS